MKQYTQIIGDVYNTPWAILPSKLEAITSALEARISGALSLSKAEIDTMAAANAPPQYQPGQSIAVLPLFGTLHHHGSMLQRASGGTSTAMFGKEFKAAMADDSIGAVVIHANGPGGTVYGTQELSEMIHSYRGKKKIVTHVDGRAASATYWVASAADEMYVTPSGEVGSIGIVCAHRDVSKMEEQAGVKTTLIALPSKKVAANPYEPLSEEVAAEIMADHQVYYQSFLDGVARNRGVTVGTVKDTYGGGGMELATKAAALGMVDGVKTFDQVISDVAASIGTKPSRSSASRKRAIQLALAQE